MNTPLFSILIAQYNNGNYLAKAIDSVKSQTYTNWEIILVDDFSTDNSKNLYKQYESDDRIKIYYNDENKGCGYTKRRCAELANGELCGFLDPDDALTPDALEIMVEMHNTNPQNSLIGSCYWACNENLVPDWHSTKRIVPEGYSYLTNAEHAPLAFASYKNAFYKKTQGIDADLKRAVDLDLFLKLEEIAPLLYLDNILYYYRLHKTNISTSGDYKGLFWHCLVITKACYRRGINPETVVNDLLVKHMKFYVQNYLGVSQLGQKISFFHRVKRKIKKCAKKIIKKIF
ncbi:MAG: glycosyltransferase [Prevotellaceae bacterium]|jgi:glycosyltransferase involved in cell wall biosynthesis|nr:glycosyltransferase [Prevotellaceae bacterium]